MLGRVAAPAATIILAAFLAAGWTPLGGAEPPTSPPFQVPAGHIGDKVVYEVEWTEIEDAYESPTNRKGHFSLAYELLGLGNATDRAGRNHEVLLVRFEANLTDFNDFTWMTVNDTRGIVAGIHGVDLATREIVHRWSIESRRPNGQFPNITSLAYGPLQGYFPVAAWGMDLDTPWMYAFQNESFGSDPHRERRPVTADAYRAAPVPTMQSAAWPGTKHEPPRVTQARLSTDRVAITSSELRLSRSSELDMDSFEEWYGSRFTMKAWVNATFHWKLGGAYPREISGSTQVTGVVRPFESLGRGTPGEYDFRIVLKDLRAGGPFRGRLRRKIRPTSRTSSWSEPKHPSLRMVRGLAGPTRLWTRSRTWARIRAWPNSRRGNCCTPTT